MLDDVWIVVPCYNEERVLREVLAELVEAFPHVALVDDASQDQSPLIARATRGVSLVEHPINLGQGAAIGTGLAYALLDPSCRRLVTFDADGQHKVADALAMVERLGEQDDEGRAIEVVLGTRFGLGRVGRMGLMRRLLLRGAVAHTRLTTRLKVTDAHNGLRAMTREVAERLDLRQTGMAHASEILQQIAAAGFAWAEHPVDIRYTRYARKKGQPALNAVNILVDLSLRPRP